MPLLVRPWTRADASAAIHVVRTVYDEFGWPWEEGGYHADLYDVEAHYLQHGGAFVVAELHGEVVGTAALEIFEPIPGDLLKTAEVEGRVRASGADCSLERMYVLPAARRQGVGRALFEAIVREAQSKGGTVLEIWSDKRLSDAHRLYESLGAVRVGERLCHDPDQSPEWGMVLPMKMPAPNGSAGSIFTLAGEA